MLFFLQVFIKTQLLAVLFEYSYKAEFLGCWIPQKFYTSSLLIGNVLEKSFVFPYHEMIVKGS